MEFLEIPEFLSELFSSGGAWLLLAFLLGLVHAFDADHVMALSVLATRKHGVRHGVQAGVRWAIGHGIVLLAVGAGLLLLGRALPPHVALASERLVGVVMILLGLTVCRDLLRRRTHLHFHTHDDLRPHAHWHTHENAADALGDAADHSSAHASGQASRERSGHGHGHAAVMVGALHGMAGSAPILAVLPAAARSPLLGLAYLLFFAVGVALAMGFVSGLIGHFAAALSGGAQAKAVSILRACCASGSMALGTWMAVAG